MAGVLAGVLRRVGRGRTTRGVRMALRELRTAIDQFKNAVHTFEVKLIRVEGTL